MTSESFVQSCSNLAAELSSNYGSGQPTIDLMFCALALGLLACILSVRNSKKNITKYTVIDMDIITAMITRVSELEISVGELKSYIKQNTEHLKGETNFIKVELQDLLGSLEKVRNRLPTTTIPSRDIFINEEMRLQRVGTPVKKVVGE